MASASGSGAGEALFRGSKLKFGRGAEFDGESGELIGRQSGEERFQDDLRFAQAGIEIEMQAIEAMPAAAGVRSRAAGKVTCGLTEFAFELAESAAKDAQFAGKSGAAAEEYEMKEAVPRRGILGGIAAEESRVQGLDGGRLADVAAARERGFAEDDEVR